jgi:hypothetical protein
LQPAAGEFKALFGATKAAVDPAMAEFGLDHLVYGVGDKCYIEICAPQDPEASTTAVRHLRRNGGDSSYMVVLEVDDAKQLRETVLAAGLSLPLAREHQGNELTHLHPREFGILTEADQILAEADWHYAEIENVLTAETVTGIVATDIAVDDPSAMAIRWASVFGQQLDEGATELHLDGGGTVRFVTAQEGRTGAVAFDVAVVDRDQVGKSHHIAGVEVRLV